MSGNVIQGFVAPKIQNLQLKDKDCKKYGIKADDFEKVDKNKDGLISADEFLGSGLDVYSVFNAFKTMAKQNDGFLEGDVLKNSESIQGAQNVNLKNPQKNSSNINSLNRNGVENNEQNSYNLNHPNVTSHVLAQKYDYMA